jgi:hypothetical protein
LSPLFKNICGLETCKVNNHFHTVDGVAVFASTSSSRSLYQTMCVPLVFFIISEKKNFCTVYKIQ